jgi:signal transduction histidine kinase
VLLAETLRSSTLKLALISIGIFGAAVIALFSYVYWSTASYVRGIADRTIAAEHEILQKAYDDAGRDGLIAAIGQRVASGRPEGGFYLLADPSFAHIAGNLESWPPSLKNADGWDTFRVPAREPDAADQPLLRANFTTLSDGYHLLVGKDIDDLRGFGRKIDTALALGIVLIFVLAGVASLYVTRRTVGRIEAINATSRSIMLTGLGKRIPLRGTRDEWDQLAQNLNLMLDRIEALMGEVKQATDNVAHDLRTPLTRMRGRLEKAYGRPRDGPDDQSLISDTIADLDGVLAMFTSLTRISQIEANDRTAAFRAVNLAEIANEVVELFDAAAEDKGAHLKSIGAQSAFVAGDRDLLFDAVANLVDNAIKHGRDAGEVIVEVTKNEDGAAISVRDDGPGIPSDECRHVLKRFYRLERSRRTPGNGLGLSLVAAVARLHGAAIEMSDNGPGLKFGLTFPRPSAQVRSVPTL